MSNPGLLSTSIDYIVARAAMSHKVEQRDRFFTSPAGYCLIDPLAQRNPDHS
jgi:hypothetical protein